MRTCTIHAHPPPVEPRQDPEWVVLSGSENALRIMPPGCGQMPARKPCRHVAASRTSAHPPPEREESRGQPWWVRHAQRGVRERVVPLGHHDPHPPGNLACSAPCPLRGHERRPALECPRCNEDWIAEAPASRSHVLFRQAMRAAIQQCPPPGGRLASIHWCSPAVSRLLDFARAINYG